MKNIVLLGFMGTGKTVCAKALSEKLNLKYISTDELIEKREKMSIKDIFSKKGEEYFRNAEKEAVKEASLAKGAVIDAGGGAVIHQENLKNLRENGVIICLWADPKVILKRTIKFSHRPLLNVKDPLKKVKELLEARKDFYERADHHIHNSKMSIEEVLSEIEGIMKSEQ